MSTLLCGIRWLKRGFQPYERNARSKTRLAREIELTQAISRDNFQPYHWPLLRTLRLLRRTLRTLRTYVRALRCVAWGWKPRFTPSRRVSTPFAVTFTGCFSEQPRASWEPISLLIWGWREDTLLLLQVFGTKTEIPPP